MSPSHRNGLTLVELVITISLAAIIGIPIGILLGEHLNGALRARDYTVGMNLARREMERLDGLNNFFATDLALTTTDIPNYNGYPYTLRRTVDCILGNCTSTNFGNQGVKRIRIFVFKGSLTDPVASLISYRTKHVTFGT
jgi:hypothetical protein